MSQAFLFGYEKDNPSYRREDGFYSWAGLRYFLFEYEQDLKDRACRQESKVDWNEFNSSKRDYVTVEHIYPVTPVAGEWPAFEARSESQRVILRHSLGNLLPLSGRRNAQFSNWKFSDKIRGKNGVRGYFNGSHSEIRVSQEPDWTPELVLERGLDMLDFLERRWKVSLGLWADKIKLLNLEFLANEQVPTEP